MTWPIANQERTIIQREHEGIDALIIDIIARAWHDSRGRLKDTNHPQRNVIMANLTESVAFFAEDGAFYHWCDLLGIEDPCGLLAEMVRLESKTS